MFPTTGSSSIWSLNKMNSRSPNPLIRRSTRGSNATSAISGNREISYTPRCTTDEYVRAIEYHSQQTSASTLYPGDIYYPLRRFLEFQPNTPSQTSRHYAWLVSPGKQPSSDGEHPQEPPSPPDGRSKGQSEGFTDIEMCIDAIKSNIEASKPQVLFLRGHPSPKWVSTIGAFCYVDPELFRWFLRYREGPGDDCYFDSAPSAMSNMVRFKFYTIASKVRSTSSQAKVEHLRAKAAEDLRRYHSDLKGNRGLKLGDSIMRNFHVLDERHSVVEQEAIASVFDVGRTWMNAASRRATGPPFSVLSGWAEFSQYKLLPIIQYGPKCALKSRGLGEQTVESDENRNTESLGVLPEGYGRGLDWVAAHHDRLRSLLDAFKLAAFSQNQLLNLLREKIKAETDRTVPHMKDPTLANLLYFREILQDQLENNSYMLQLIKRAQDRPLVAGSRRSSRGDHAIDEIESLFEDLQLQAQSLHGICSQGMTLLSDSSMLAESQRAMKQAKLVTKLTVAAFVYLPFTFVAGFFGMNFKELDGESISLWIFFAASLPLMAITMGFFALDVQAVRDIWRSYMKSEQPGNGHGFTHNSP